MGRIWGASGKRYSLCLFSNHIFPGVWETENLMPASHLEVDRDTENSSGRAWLPEGDRKSGQISHKPNSMGGSWVPGLLAGHKYHFLGRLEHCLTFLTAGKWRDESPKELAKMLLQGKGQLWTFAGTEAIWENLSRENQERSTGSSSYHLFWSPPPLSPYPPPHPPAWGSQKQVTEEKRAKQQTLCCSLHRSVGPMAGPELWGGEKI